MYLPRDLISHLYKHLVRTHHAQSPSILVLVALEPDALCACRILTALLKRDYIPHNIIPVSGYGDLARAGETQVRPLRTQNGGSGGTVVCLGVGGLVDLSAILGLDGTEEQPDATGGVEIWVIDARRPWNLGNVFGGKPSSEMPLAQPHSDAKTWLAETSHGKIQRNYRPGRGGVIVYDDGDIEEELRAEREAYFKLEQLPPVEDDGEESDGSETESDGSGSTVGDRPGKKRKSWSEADQDGESDNEDGRPRQRQRSNSVWNAVLDYDHSMLKNSIAGSITIDLSKSTWPAAPNRKQRSSSFFEPRLTIYEITHWDALFNSWEPSPYSAY